jgi:lipopolysaccharide/colanic/teichoic acid biosynthesis glycosyltransferase
MQLKYCTGEKYPHHKEASEFEDQLAREKNLKQGPVFKIGGDPRRTRVGRFLEKWSLDELPQFWNVLTGKMSLVGPRPHMPKEVSGYQKHHKKVFNIKPGITGLAQISGRSDLDFDEEAKIDIYYIENWSFGLDIKIMLKTPFVALFGKHKS